MQYAVQLADKTPLLVHNLRRTNVALSDLIPHLQAVADELWRLSKVETDLTDYKQAFTELGVEPATIKAGAKRSRQRSKDMQKMQDQINSAKESIEAIAERAHAASTGPAVPDDLWDIRTMAYDALQELD